MQDTAPTSPPPPTRTLSRHTQLVIVLILALIVGVALGFAWLGGHFFAGASEAKVAADAKSGVPPGAFRPTPAQLANLKVAAVATMVFRAEQLTDGKIAINNDKTTPVFSPYSGRVIKVMANLGDDVKQGAPLLAVAASEFAQGQNDLLAATSALNTARSQLNLAQTNEKRKHGLYDAKAGSLQDWLQSQADLVAAENSLRAAETALGLVRNRLRILGKSDAEIGALENAKTMDPVAFVVAPISGTVIDRQVGLGQYVQSNATTPVYSIGDLSTVWLIANVREVDAPRMRLGAPVEVHVLALPERVFKAKLTYVARSVDPNTHRLPVRAEIPNRDGVLKAEMFASFSINTGGESAAPAVPEGALVYEGETARVWVAQDDGTLTSRPIRAGRVSHGMVEIVAGLVPGEKVVTSGSLFIDRAAKGD
jgi:cobalt-zinc-cadmium efflux system membrane fusion protein